jgi:hypothetical protein
MCCVLCPALRADPVCPAPQEDPNKVLSEVERLKRERMEEEEEERAQRLLLEQVRVDGRAWVVVASGVELCEAAACES